MASEPTSAFDASTIPQLADLVEEVRRTRTRKPIQLRPDGETVAYLDPASPEPKTSKTSPRRRGAGPNYEAFRSAAGGWHDVDTDKLIEDIYRDRSVSNRPAVKL